MTNGTTYTFTYTYNLASQLVSETLPDLRTVTTAYDRAGRPTSLTGTKSSVNTTYVSTQAYGLFGLPYYYARGNNVWHAQGYNIRMQPTESYEALNNSSSNFLFVSCPNWGGNANWSVYNQCPTSYTSTDNGTLQSYAEYQGGTGYSSLLSFSQTVSHDGLNRLSSLQASAAGSLVLFPSPEPDPVTIRLHVQ